MLKFAIVDTEKNAKQIVFEFIRVFKAEVTFVYFGKISELIKYDRLDDFDVFVLSEAYNNLRVSRAIDLYRSGTCVVYCGEDVRESLYNTYSKVFYLSMHALSNDMNNIYNHLEKGLKRNKKYRISYGGIDVNVRMNDIYYVTKEDKFVIFHTKLGEFNKRTNIADVAEELQSYDFIRINKAIIVNFEYIYKIDGDCVELHNKVSLPIAKKRKFSVVKEIRKRVYNS